MSFDHTQLHLFFDHFPEAVLFVEDQTIIYTNAAAKALLPQGDASLAPLLALLSERSSAPSVTLAGASFTATATQVAQGQLLILRPSAATPPPLSMAKVPSLLRGHLSNLMATNEQIGQLLAKQTDQDAARRLMATQNQVSHRILRLARQMELTQEDWENDFPKDTVNLTDLCRRLSRELVERLLPPSPQLATQIEPAFLFVVGNRNLLEQLILSLLSNAIKSAGEGGRLELTLKAQGKRVLLSVWDNGPAIPDDRLALLFSPQDTPGLPRPQEGTGLDLWIAQRIALYHGGVIMAGNRGKEGTEFLVSLPLTPPKQLRLDSPPPPGTPSDFSPLLTGLSDVLPRTAYYSIDE